MFLFCHICKVSMHVCSVEKKKKQETVNGAKKMHLFCPTCIYQKASIVVQKRVNKNLFDSVKSFMV